MSEDYELWIANDRQVCIVLCFQKSSIDLCFSRNGKKLALNFYN